MTTIHKFQERAQEQKEEIEILSDKSNIFVLIDEAHRSQYGMTAAYMRNSLPNAKFIAFTGTPIDKEERNQLLEPFMVEVIILINIQSNNQLRTGIL